MLNYYRIMMDDSLKAQNHILLNITEWSDFNTSQYRLFDGNIIEQDYTFYAEVDTKQVEVD